jgi:hypothetical protein
MKFNIIKIGLRSNQLFLNDSNKLFQELLICKQIYSDQLKN